MDIASRLNELCKYYGFSGYRLSKLSGIAQSQVQQYLNGKKIPGVPSIEKMCAAFGITLAEFFSPAAEPEATSEEARPGDEWEPLAVRFEDGSIRPPEDLSPEQQAEIERLTKEFQEFLAWKLRKKNSGQ